MVVKLHFLILDQSDEGHPAPSNPPLRCAQSGFAGMGAGARSVARETGRRSQ